MIVIALTSQFSAATAHGGTIDLGFEGPKWISSPKSPPITQDGMLGTGGVPTSNMRLSDLRSTGVGGSPIPVKTS